MTLQERYDQLVQEEFVGREAEVEQFLSNLSLPLSSRERRYIFNVYGPKGVGKSTLLRRYRFLAQDELNVPVLSAWVNENTHSRLAFLEQIAAPFDLPQFQEHLHFYQRQYAALKVEAPMQRQPVDVSPPTNLHRKISDYFDEAELLALCVDLGIDDEDLAGDTPNAKATSLVRYCNRHNLRAALIARCVDLRPWVDWHEATVTDLRHDIDETAVWEAHVRRHIKEEEKVALLLHPIEKLTPLLFHDLSQALGNTTTLLLFVDGYEEKSHYLESWFCGLLNGRFGAVPDNIIIILAGDAPLIDSCWGNYQQLIINQPLQPFTATEAEDFLIKRGIDNSKQIENILKTVKMSGRNRYLMLDLATAVATSSLTPIHASKKSANAVTLFLKTIDEKHYREVTLCAALPRRFNADILALLLDQDDVDAELNWLVFLPFVKTASTDNWTYHDNMRGDILAYSRGVVTSNWAELHSRLASYYQGYRAKACQHLETGWHDETWQRLTLEIQYHRLCQSRASRRRHLSLGLGEFLIALQTNQKFAQRWAETIEQAGKDCGSKHIQEWGRFLRSGIDAFTAGNYEETAVMLSRLIDRKTLEDRHRIIALRWRGDTYRHLHDNAKAIADYNQALAIDPNYAWAYASRAETYRWLEQYEEAIADFDKAIELDPEFVWAIAHRGEMYRKLWKNEKALADFNRAIELDPNLAWVIASRGELYRTMDEYDFALADLDQAIELNPTYAWAIASRAQTYRKMGQLDAALADFDQAVQINPDYYWAIAGRAQTHRKLEQYDEAVDDFTQAVTLNPKYAWAVAERGKTYRKMGVYDKALEDFDQALVLNPDYNWALVGRGETYRLMGKKEKALEDFDKALENNPQDAWTHRRRERVLRKNGE